MGRKPRKYIENRKYKHLTLTDRFQMEALFRANVKKAEIAKIIGCSRATVYNEFSRGKYMHRLSDWTEEERYASERAYNEYKQRLKKKGRTAKLALDKEQAAAIEKEILENRYSPAAALAALKKAGREFEEQVTSVNTVYAAIEKGYFPNLKLEDLPDKGRHKKKKKDKKTKPTKRISKGTSIEKRPEKIKERKEAGHWEMDTVKGKATNKKCLLVLTERFSRKEIIEPLKACTTVEVVRAMNRIEKRYGSKFYTTFLSITVDNGSEFADYKGIEKALHRVGNRTEVFFCHPHCPHERGSNEVQNKLIRRFFPKGDDFDAIVSKALAKECESWINAMPRKILGWKSADEVFESEGFP